MNTKEQYSKMQENYYDQEANKWSLDNKDPVVSWYHEHQAWTDYDTCLFRFPEDTKEMVALDFGCGPGRSMVRYADRFKRIDGSDISRINLDKVGVNLAASGITMPDQKLYHSSGDDVGGTPDNAYDVVFSVICLQHICSHTIRYSIMKDIYRTLKPGGWFCAQMGFGLTHLTPYLSDFYGAGGTNGANDVCFDNEEFLKTDLTEIGFKNYSSVIRPPCQDQHPKWIWFQGQKQ